MILNDRELRELRPLEPFIDQAVRSGVISYGVDSFGYDCRLGYNFKKLRPGDVPLDPKNPNPNFFMDFTVDPRFPFEMAAGEVLLGETIEEWTVPDNCRILVLSKSSYVRCGVLGLATPAEPGWKGVLTLELVNLAPRPVLVYPGEGICSLVFMTGNRPDETYADRKYGAKYQNQPGVTLSKVAP